MFKDILKRMLILAGTAAAVLGIVILGLGAFLFLQQPASRPLVTIHSPAPGEPISPAQPVSVQTTSRDEKNKITKVELWEMQEGNLHLVSLEESIQPDHKFSVALGWQPVAAGSYRLLVRAFNDQGDTGQAAVDIQVEEGSQDPVAADPIQEEAAPAPGIFNPGPASLASPGEGGALEDGPGGSPPHPDLQPTPYDSDFQLAGVIFGGLGNLDRPEKSSRRIKFEALEFEVAESYDRVVCYSSIAGSPYQRIPESGFLSTSGENQWNISDYLGGDASLEITMEGNQALEYTLKCSGYRNEKRHLIGRLNTNHPLEDWNGQIIQSYAQEGEGFKFTYRIIQVHSDIPAPMQFSEIRLNNQASFLWGWAGDPGEIEGFQIYRDHILVASVPPDGQALPISPWWTDPLCGEEYAYHVTAYRGNVESPPSNTLRYQGEACEEQTGVALVSWNINCGGAGERILIRYLNVPEEIDSIDVRAYQNGEEVAQVYSAPTQIASGSGTAQIPLTYHGTETLTTDQIAVHLRDSNQQDRYLEVIDHIKRWVPGQPDLRIQEAWIDPANHTLFAEINNQGCACPPVENPLIRISRSVDGGEEKVQLMETIQPRLSALMTLELSPSEMHLWQDEIQLLVDPLNEVEESVEHNNMYTIGSPRINAVQFYKIEIENIHDRDGEGELTFLFTISGRAAWRNYQWSVGEHQINNLYLHPESEYFYSGDHGEFFGSLLVQVTGYEFDPMSRQSNIGSTLVISHPYDASEENSWKHGGEYSAQSDTGDFTVYYRIILE